MTEEEFQNKIKDEGDFFEFIYLDFKCQIIRHRDFKHLNGYIFLTPDNDYFGVLYDDVDVKVHGGWTYCRQDENFWVVGFDCAHFGDFTSKSFFNVQDNSTYKDFQFVKSQLEFACEQFQKKSSLYRRGLSLTKLLQE